MAALRPILDPAPVASVVGKVVDALGPATGLVVAIITAAGVVAAAVIARKMRPAVTMNEVWNKNKEQGVQIEKLLARMRKMERKQAVHDRVIGVLGDGFAAHDRAIQRSGVQMDYTPSEAAAIDQARRLRDDTALWEALRNPPEEEETDDTQ